MKERKSVCPTCGYGLLAREDDDIICLAPACNWRIESKRKGDLELPKFQELRDIYNA